MTKQRGVNRRLLMKGVAGGAVAPAAIAGSVLIEGAASTPPTATVAATVVRTTHSGDEPATPRAGVRVSVRSEDFSRDGLVLVVEPVLFGISATEAGEQIAAGPR